MISNGFGIGSSFIFSLLLASCSFLDLSIDIQPDVKSMESESFVNNHEMDEILFMKEEEILLEKGKKWLFELCDSVYMGRRAGTKGDSLAYAFILNELEEMHYSAETQFFYTENGTLLRNIIVKIPGVCDSTVVVGAHYDGATLSNAVTHYPAAEDNASGVVTLLMVLKFINDFPLKTNKTILCCFWDSEEVFEGRAFRGSEHFTDSISEEELESYLFYQNLDTIGHDHGGRNEIYLEYVGEGRMIKTISHLASNNRFNYNVSVKISFASDYYSFYKIGIPFLCYHDHKGFTCDNPNHSVDDIPDVISIDRLINIAQIVCEAIVVF